MKGRKKSLPIISTVAPENELEVLRLENNRLQAENAELKRAEEVQVFLSQTTSSPTDEPFLKLLARFLGKILRMECVCIDRLEGDGLMARTVAIWCEGKFKDNASHSLKDTPCGVVVGQSVCCFPSGVAKLFPRHEILQELKAESYVGITLWNHTGEPIGLISVIGREPLKERSLAELTLQRVAVRAAGELERQQWEEALRASNELFSLFMHYSPIYAFIKEVTPSESRVIQASDNYQNMIGVSGREMLGKTMTDLFPPEFAAKITADDWAVASRGNILKTDETLNGRQYTTIKFPIVQGDKTLLAGYTIDITDRVHAEDREKELQAKLERAARMESLGVLAGGVAHDLNNVLGPIVSLPDLVIEYLGRHRNPADSDSAEVLEAMKIMKASALRAAGVVSDLVVMGRRGQFHKEPVDINRVVEQVLDSRQIKSIQVTRPGVQVIKHMSHDPLWCLGSEMRLIRVLANLVSNAMEAISGAGDVTVSTGHKVLSVPLNGYELVPPGEYVTLEVADTGCGMDSKLMGRIFEPFFSTKAANERCGSGLGLSVVHGLVRDHAGYLDARSAPGAGTSFTVYLHAVPVAPPATGRAGQAELPRGHERILVVDDEPGQRFLLRKLLGKVGYIVAEADGGEEAVALFEASRKAGMPDPFDLVMTDMRMKGIDGLAVCQTIRQLYPLQKLLIMSGYAPDGHEDLVKSLDIMWLNKPFTAYDLATTVRLRLDR